MHTIPKLLITAAALGALAPLSATRALLQANDEVTLKDGTRQSGKIVAETYDALEMTVKKAQQKYEWSQVADVRYGGAPKDWAEAAEALEGSPEDALAKYQALAANDKLRDVLRQGALFRVASLERQLGRAKDAVSSWLALARAFPAGRYLGEAAQGLVDGYLAQNNSAEGSKALETLARESQASGAPASFQAEVTVLRGRLLEAQDKFAEARTAYESVEAQAGVPAPVVAAAKLGIGECLRREGKTADAETRFRQIVGGEGPSRLLAGAWNGLGDILQDQGKKKRDADLLLEALYAYLRGVVQYPPLAGEPTDQHERALAGAADCFDFVAQLEKDKDRKSLYEQRAAERRDSLNKLYPDSKYARN